MFSSFFMLLQLSVCFSGLVTSFRKEEASLCASREFFCCLVYLCCIFHLLCGVEGQL